MTKRAMRWPAESNCGFAKAEVEEILADQYRRIDLLMERFLLIHCAIAFSLAFVYSTWMITVPVALSAFLMFATCRRAMPGALVTRCVAGVALQVFVALHIYQLHGLPEMHFFFFTAQTMMILYYDWRALWLGTVLIIAQHMVFAALTNAGYRVNFYPDTYVTIAKQFFHYSVAVGQVGICAYWANYLRNGLVRDARQRLELEQINLALGDEIDVRKLAERRLEHQASHDPVTGLPNRTRFEEEHILAAESVRRGKSPGYAVLFIDLDHFKYVNDALGHDVGDKLLYQVARRLETCLAGSGTVARFGGDEFTALINHCDSSHIACYWATVVLTAFEAPIELLEREISVSVSVGVAVDLTGKRHTADILREADIALYGAKLNGRGRYIAFDDAMAKSAADKVQIGNELRGAETRGELCVYYQPIVSLADGAIEGFEALARWNHPTRGLLLPGAFIPIAEENGLIDQIGDWVLRTACCQISEWNAAFGRTRRLKVAVNQSDRELHHTNLAKRVKSALESGGTDASDLIIEITENVAIDGTASSFRTLQVIRDMGCELHLDDFATGRASLSALLRLPVSAIKIDRSFVSGLFRDRKNKDIVVALVRMAESMGLSVIAEGVESLEQADFIRALGCNLVQGMAFDMPMSADRATELLRRAPRYLDRVAELSAAS